MGVSISNSAYALGAICYVFYKFNRPGIAATTKTGLIRQYVLFVIVFSVLQIFILQNLKPSFKYYEYDPNNPTMPAMYMGGTKYLNSVWKCSITSFGFLIALAKMQDPAVWDSMTGMLTCRNYRRKLNRDLKSKDTEYLTLNTFLTTSLNTELVIAILQGILVLAAGSSDNKDHLHDGDLLRVKQTTTIEIAKIQISNAKQWEVSGIKGVKEERKKNRMTMRMSKKMKRQNNLREVVESPQNHC